MPFHSGKGAGRRTQAVSCETCSNYVYDEDYGYYVCEADLMRTRWQPSWAAGNSSVLTII